jgi:hypothetical protein
MFLIEPNKKIMSKSKFRHLALKDIEGITCSKDKKEGKGGGLVLHPV